MRYIRYLAVAVISLLLSCPVFSQNMVQAPDGLVNIFAPGYILLDNNNDSHIDFLNLHLLVSEFNDDAITAATGNISARLGYETTALDLNFAQIVSPERIYTKPVIAIGNHNLWNSDTFLSSQLTLAPAQGEIRFLQPNDYFRSGAIVVSGNDATGLLAASEYFAGRFPSIWIAGKTEISEVTETVNEFFSQRNIPADRIIVSGIVVDRAISGLVRIEIIAEFPNSRLRDYAESALKDRETEVEKEMLEISDLQWDGVHRVLVKLRSGTNEKTVILKPAELWEPEEMKQSVFTKERDFSLADLYSLKGLYSDTDKDFLPDDINSFISVRGNADFGPLSDLAARIGLESAGLSIPLVRITGIGDEEGKFGFPVLYGKDHPEIRSIIMDDKLYEGPEGTGYIQFITDKKKSENSIIISGNSFEEMNAATDYVAGRLPYLWEYGKGNVRLEELEKASQDFFRRKNSAGQAAIAIQKIRAWLDRLKGRNITAVNVEIASGETPGELENFAVESVFKAFPSADVDVSVYPTGFGTGETIFTEEFELTWEVDEFREIFRSDILPGLFGKKQCKIVLTVSESPEVRSGLKKEIEEALETAGITEHNVTVRCAYKQGYFWLTEEILPQLKNKKAKRVEIMYHHLGESEEIKWQAIHADTRWLQEIYPSDVIMAKTLGINDSLISFHSTLADDPIYTVRAFDRKDREILTESFSPHYVVRPYFDLFPEYDNVRVTTGWIEAESGGISIVDRRIKTDPERFWDHLQTVTYQKIIDYTMDIQDGRPSSALAPYFDEFRVYLTMSEPNYRIGVDEEVISSTEAMHEDIYFETIVLFNLIGARYHAGNMNYPGRILPFIQPPQDGKPAKARIEFTGKKRARPEIVMTWTEQGKEPVTDRYDINIIKIEQPKLRGIWVAPDIDKPARLQFDVMVTDSLDRYEEMKLRGSEETIDATFISAENLAEKLDILHEFHNRGIFEDVLSYDRAEELSFRFIAGDSLDYTLTKVLPASSNPKSSDNPTLFDNDFTYDGKRIVQWDSPIGPEEAETLMARLNTFPNINTYYMTHSFLGKPVFIMDVLPQVDAQYISQAKLNILKPTLFISGRQHANEVSSTSHILRMAELAATDTAYSNYLKKVNLVLQPIVNIDGAGLVEELLKDNPDFMLHAGYLGPLAVDVDSDSRSPEPRYPESSVRNTIRDTWLPDVYLNPHGYPSHEWVQYFAGYSAWVRGRNVRQRSWWSPRGWFIPSFRWHEDNKFPEYKEASFELLDTVTAAVYGIPEIREMNSRMYRLYRKYASQDRRGFREHFHNGILTYTSMQGRKVDEKTSRGSKVTYFSLTTEAPDETAWGDWLRLLCEAGLAHETAVLKYLAEGDHRVKHSETEKKERFIRKVTRKRPVLPFKEEEDKGK